MMKMVMKMVVWWWCYDGGIGVVKVMMTKKKIKNNK